MSTPTPSNIKTIKYKVTATVHKVKIGKKLKFFSKVQWKRHENNAETSLVEHREGFSQFNQELVLQFSMYYDTAANTFLQKKCDMMVIIDIDGNGTIKNGGYARFDLAQAINQGCQRVDKKLNLIKNPDPDAFIQFSLLYQPLEEIDSDQMSVLNASTINTSTMYISEKELQIGKQTILQSQFKKQTSNSSLFDLVSKFQSLASKIKNKQIFQNNQSHQKQSKQFEKMQMELKRLKMSTEDLENKLQKSENSRKNLQKQIFSLQSKNEQQKQYVQNQVKNNDVGLTQYKQMSIRLQNQQKQLQKFRMQVKSGQSFNDQEQDKKINLKLKQLESEKVKLQKHLADKSNKIGQLFNAAYEFGGAELLDKLQSAIGLIQEM